MCKPLYDVAHVLQLTMARAKWSPGYVKGIALSVAKCGMWYGAVQDKLCHANDHTGATAQLAAGCKAILS